MKRRRFLGGSLAGGAMFGAALPQQPLRNMERQPEVVLERPLTGKPRQGQTVAAIQPHSDDIPLFAAGTVLKLVDEGCRGILIRTTNDEMAGRGDTLGEVILNNERDNFEVARRMGLEKVFDLRYRNHLMDGVDPIELRARLIFLFRLMKVDIVVCYDPWSHYEENPDHYVTARAVEAACWMSGGRWDFPEHFEAGLEAHSVTEKYYFARGPQLVNRVVDISDYIDGKVHVNLANVTQGPAGETGAALRRRLAAEGRRLPELGDDDDTANREYIKRFVLAENAEWGRRHGVEYAEPFHYIGPRESAIEREIEENATPL